MDGPALADTVDSSDSLFETHRVPWQLEVDHDPAPLVQVQPLASRVGGEKEPAAAADELIEGGGPFLARQAAVQDCRRPLQHGVEMQQRVAIFRENDDWLSDAIQEAGDRRELRFVSDRRARSLRQLEEHASLTCFIPEREISGPPRRLIVRIELAAWIGQRQIELPGAVVARWRERRQAPFDRYRERPRAGERPLVQNR